MEVHFENLLRPICDRYTDLAIMVSDLDPHLEVIITRKPELPSIECFYKNSNTSYMGVLDGDIEYLDENVVDSVLATVTEFMVDIDNETEIGEEYEEI